MKTILIVGVSGTQSIGYEIGETLKKDGHTVVYASRGGRLGVACDITDSTNVAQVLKVKKPDVVIHAAGVFPELDPIGSITDWPQMRQNIEAKTFGSLVLLDAAVAYRSVGTFIFMGGARGF